ncbi:uncharacterized protein LOC119682257 [Teleopsis dalmanni]|uniref:uncharacterized protein LOC119682257 n=1 Tax=Teleopsis dalmanni TaxID=139649 RepID=UPI0018CE7AFF|nr:uncharacterized protein LOC119682257 [Teleopsis dalmanni]
MMESKDTQYKVLRDCMANNEASIEDNIIVEQFIEDEVLETSTKQLLLQNDILLYSVIEMENETIKNESEAIVSETEATGVLVGDHTSHKNSVIAQQFIQNEIYDILTLENKSIKMEPKNTVVNRIIDDQSSFESAGSVKVIIKDKETEATMEQLLENKSVLKNDKSIHKPKSHNACDICEEKFSSSSLLTAHRRSHTAEKPYTCTECYKNFTAKQSLCNHMKQHTGEKPYSCTECEQRFARQYTLNVHMRRHFGQKPYKCSECDKNFAVKQELNLHMRRHTGEKPFTCTECDKNFAVKHELDVHMRRHTGQKPYKCTECKRHFARKYTLDIHMKRHTGKKQHVCNKCGKQFLQRVDLLKHSKTHECDKHDVESKTSKDIQQYTRIHSSESKREHKAQGHKFKCKECKSMFGTEAELKNHYDIEHHIDSNKDLKSHILETSKEHVEIYHKTNITQELENNRFEWSLSKIYRIDDFNDNAIENVTATDNNVLLRVKTEHTSMKDEQEFIKNEVTELNADILLPNEIHNSQKSDTFEDDIGKQHFIKEEVCETVTENLSFENELYTIITVENETIKMEPETTLSEASTNVIMNDRTLEWSGSKMSHENFKLIAENIIALFCNESAKRNQILKSKLKYVRMKRRRIIAKIIKVMVANKNAYRIFTGKQRSLWMKERNGKFWEHDVLNNSPNFFKESFHMNRQCFNILCNEIRGIERNTTSFRQCISLAKRVAIALYALCTSREYSTIGKLFGVSKASVCVILKEFCSEVWRVMAPQYLSADFLTEEKLEKCVKGFKKIGFPQCFGAIGGCHIEIKPTKKDALDYFNYKGWYSMVLLALVDCRHQFMYINVGAPGRCNDSSVFEKSSLKKFLESPLLKNKSEYISGKRVPVVCVADSAFRFSTSIMKPYPVSTTNEQYKNKFNYQLLRARRVVEKAFDHLKARFSRVGKGLDNNVNNAALIIKCCCVLHNFLNEHNDFINTKWQYVQKEYESKNYRLQPQHKDFYNDNNPQAEEFRRAIADCFGSSDEFVGDDGRISSYSGVEIDPLATSVRHGE